MGLAEPTHGKPWRTLDFTRSWIGLEIAEEGSNQRSLARAIGADDADAIAGTGGEREVFEADSVAERLGNIVGDEREVAHRWWLGQVEVHHAQLGVLFDKRAFLEALKPSLSSACLLGALAGLVAIDERLLLANLVLLLSMLSLDGEHALDALRAEGGVVSRVLVENSAIDFDDAVDHAVEQPAIVGDEDNAAAEFVGEEVLEPAAADDVEVVGGLVEKKQVGAGKQQPREAEARPLSARKRRNREVEVVVGEAEAVQRGVDLVINRIAARGLDCAIERHLTAHELFEFIGLGGTHALVDAFEFLLELVDGGECFGGGATQSFVWWKPRILLEVADADGARDLNFAVVRLDRAGDEFEQRALAATIATDQANALTLVN